GVEGLAVLVLAEPAAVGYLIDELTLRHGNSSSVAVRTRATLTTSADDHSAKPAFQAGFQEEKAQFAGSETPPGPPWKRLRSPRRSSRRAAAAPPGRCLRRGPSAVR